MDSQLHNQTHQVESYSRAEAESRDAQDPLRSFREQFIIPSKSDLQRKTLAGNDSLFSRSADLPDQNGHADSRQTNPTPPIALVSICAAIRWACSLTTPGSISSIICGPGPPKA